ncbi:MCE family protein [Pseudonocardia pini]|uniref:MCE family protein n=1 Tax=Pseudonocardia pini TaxID=2758030 RepID=UPI0015F016A7|nr:MCE family protein [Pseudonocardia pini]
MTSFVKRQLVIFTVLSVAAFAIIAFGYLRVPTLLGLGQMSVTARVPVAGGIYPNANVTYRGATIGKVTDVRLAEDGGVDVVMSVDAAQAPPEDSRAEIHSVSAIGEQFVDFVPTDTPSSTALADGAFVPEERTSIPLPTAAVLDDVDTLLKTVNPDDLSVVLREFDTAFRGIGPDLASIADNTKLLLDTADVNYAQTEQLIRDAEPFLDSQVASADDARAWSARLARVTEQLEQSDSDLRGALRNGEAAGQQAGNLLDQLRGPTPTLIDNTLVLTRLAEAYHAPIEQVLVTYPAFAAFYQSALGPNGRESINFNIKLNPNRPACYEGWVGPGTELGPRDAFELSDMPFPADQYCKLAQDDDRLVRGSRNLPCFEPGSPVDRRSATVEQCRGDGFTSGVGPGTQLQIGGPLNDLPLTTTPTPADTLVGADPGPPGTAPSDLRGLLLPPSP